MNPISTTKVIAKNTYYNFIVAVIYFFTSIITSILVARLLQPELFGTYHLYFRIITTAIILATLAYPNITRKYISETDGYEKTGITSAVLFFIFKRALIVSVVITIALVVATPFLARFYNIQHLAQYLFIGALLIIPTTVNRMLISAIQGIQKFKYITKCGYITMPITLVLTVTVLVRGYGITGLILSGLFSVIIQIILVMYVSKHDIDYFKKPGLISGDLKNRINKFNYAQIGNIILDQIVWERSEVFFLGFYRTVKDVGFYSLGFGLVNSTIRIIPSTFSAVLLPAMSKAYGARKIVTIKNIYYHSTRYLLISTLPLCVGGIILAKPVIELMYGMEYISAVIVFQIIILGVCSGLITESATHAMYAMEYQNHMLKLNFTTAILNIALNFALIPSFGIVGAAIGSAVSQGFSSISTLVLFMFLQRVEYPFSTLIKTIIAALLMGVITFGVYDFVSGPMGISLSILAGVAVYGTSLIFMRVFNKDDENALIAITNILPICLQRPFNYIRSLLSG